MGEENRNWNLINCNQRESRGAKLLPTLGKGVWEGIVPQIKGWVVKGRNWIYVFKKRKKKVNMNF